MADKDKPEEVTEKKKGLLSGSKIPLDGVLLVVVPFMTFVVLFMYVMGLLPPRPMTVRVVGATTMDRVEAPVAGTMEAAAPVMPPETGRELAPGTEDRSGPEVMRPLPPESAENVVADAGGVESSTQGSAPESAVTDQGVEAAPSTEVAGVDEERMERIKQLAKVYEQMNASSVAAIVANMHEDDAVDILSNMKARNAAKVLASLEPETAAKLSLRLTE